MSIPRAYLNNPNACLNDHFEQVMEHNSAPLFASYETYKASLPVRKILQQAEPLKLIDLPFFARDEDMEVTMKRLEYQSSAARNLVRYAVSPTCTGKTACICPAFLRSAARMDDDGRPEKKFEHYLYMAFSNNHGRMFHVENTMDISKEEAVAEAQGAKFMLGCLIKLLKCEFGGVQIPTEDDILSLGTGEATVKSIAEDCRQLLDSNINSGRVLIHVDEHRNMSKEHPYFRRGALSVIGYEDDNRAVVVATHVEVPTEVSSEKSSGVCRHAVPVPLLDINSALRHANCIDAAATDLTRAQKRFLATLKFRIAAYLSGNMPLFHLAYSMDEANNSSPAKSMKGVLRVYTGCVSNSINPRSYREYWKREREQGGAGLMASFIRLTPYHTGNRGIDDQAMELLLGVTEQFVLDEARLQSRLVSFPFRENEARLTYGLQDLVDKRVSSHVAGCEAFKEARNKFFDALLAEDVEDLLSGQPLERAYLWSLTTMSSHFEEIALEKNARLLSLNFTCREVASGRIFPGSSIFMDDSETDLNMDVGWMEPQTIYYAREGEDGLSSHPLGDIFFLTTKNELVVFDITASGGTSKAMTRKRQHSKRFIDAWNRGSSGQGLVVVLVSPLEEGTSKVSSDHPQLRYIYGGHARELLGGLVQFLAWY